MVPQFELMTERPKPQAPSPTGNAPQLCPPRSTLCGIEPGGWYHRHVIGAGLLECGALGSYHLLFRVDGRISSHAACCPPRTSSNNG